MQHLARFGLAHQKLDSSRILLLPENSLAATKSGQVKIGTVRSTLDEQEYITDRVCSLFRLVPTHRTIFARPLGIIAFEMMEKGSAPEHKELLVLSGTDKWSPEASDFLYVASWGDSPT